MIRPVLLGFSTKHEIEECQVSFHSNQLYLHLQNEVWVKNTNIPLTRAYQTWAAHSDQIYIHFRCAGIDVRTRGLPKIHGKRS